MYLVQVYDSEVFVCDKTFAFGEWAEIGFWIDNNGFNDKHFNLRIRFIEI